MAASSPTPINDEQVAHSHLVRSVDPGETDDSVSSSFAGPLVDFALDPPLPNGHFDSFAPDFAHDFSTFMDTVPNLSYTFSPTYQPLPVLFGDSDFSSLLDLSAKEGRGARGTDPTADRSSTAPTSSTADSLLSRYGSRLPSLQPDDAPRPPVVSPDHQNLNSRHFLVTAQYRQGLVDCLAQSLDTCVDKDFVLPSRHALARYVGSYFKNFHDHYPFFHVPTLQLENIDVELFLSIAALGARYTREEEAGIDLYNMARSVAFERLGRRRKSPVHAPSDLVVHGSPISPDPCRPEPVNDRQGLLTDSGFQNFSLSQTFLLLIAIASWYKRAPAATDALSIRSVLHALALEDARQIQRVSPEDSWNDWVRCEAQKRTQLVIFCFFNIHTILFDLPPMMLASELNLDLPCSEAAWRATSEQEWRDVGGTDLSRAPTQRFHDAFANLFVDGDGPRRSPSSGGPTFSALAGCALIHAVIQQIWLVRHSRVHHHQHGERSLANEDIGSFERALKRWASCWERNQESSMDPLSPDGPVTFTSTALLRLAYIRLNMDLGPVRSLGSWDPHIVAQSLYKSPAARRSDKLTWAALHCAHALSIPIKLGINYVAQTQLIHWSNQHALCSLECAVLLAKWLEEVTPSEPIPPLTEVEGRVLDFVVHLVAEADYKVSCEQISQRKEHLGAMSVHLWGKLYQSNSVWEMVNLIGQSLNLYAELLEAGTPKRLEVLGHI